MQAIKKDFPFSLGSLFIFLYSAIINCSLQSIHITFIFFVALKLLPQQGQIYFLVLDFFRGFFGVSAPLPFFAPPIWLLPKLLRQICISSNSCLIQKLIVSSVGSVNVHPYLGCRSICKPLSSANALIVCCDISLDCLCL